MRRRRSVAFLVALGVATLPAMSVASGGHRRRFVQVTVQPTTGSPHSRFVVSFRAPSRTGEYGAYDREYQVSVTGPAQSGCSWRSSAAVPPTRRGQQVQVTLHPRFYSGQWCPGAYRGRVRVVEWALCPRGDGCPTSVVPLGVLGRFAFQVVKGP